MPGVTTAYQTGTHASRPAASSGCILYSCTDHGLVYRSDGSTWATFLTLPAAGGAGGTSPEWWHEDSAPEGADDEEFDSGAVIGTLTRVYNSGTPKGSWAETRGGLEWTQSAGGGTEIDGYAVPLSLSVGDHVTLAFRYPVPWMTAYMGAFLGMADGASFGSGACVGANAYAGGAISSVHRVSLNNWAGFNSRASDGTPIDIGQIPPVGIRVKYEAANTWGLYVRYSGSDWRTVQTNYALTLTPTYALFGICHIAAPSYTAGQGKRIRLETFRVND